MVPLSFGICLFGIMGSLAVLHGSDGSIKK
jgi:hypothetical protein